MTQSSAPPTSRLPGASHPHGRGILEMSAAMLLSGSIGYFVLLSGEAPLQVVFWRCAFGALALAPLCWALGLLRPPLLTKRQLAMAILAGSAIVINWILLFSAYNKASIGITTVVYNVQPFMLVGLGALFLGERPSPNKLAWLVVAFAGVLLIIGEKPEGAYLSGGYMSGILLSIGAAAFYAAGAILIKQLKGVPPLLLALIQALTGCVLLSPALLAAPLPETAGAWASLATLGMVHTGVMYGLLYGAIQKLPTPLTAALSYIYPVAALVIDTAALGVELHPLQILGAGIIILAAAGVTLDLRLKRLPRISARKNG